jgi:phosphate transport system substrate-binding protein
VLIAALLAIARADGARADEALAGTLTSVGSDTAGTLVARWAGAFHARHPLARIQAQAPGSASAPIALIEGAADLGPMSRPMTAAEEQAFSARFGYAPTRIVVAHDAIAVFVHPDNPLERITLAGLDSIYSSTHACGDPDRRRWGDVDGLAQPPRERPILAIGRDSGSGTHELFRALVLCGGRYRPEVVAWPGNGAVVAGVAGNRNAIGYAGAGYVNGLVRTLAIARGDRSEAVLPDARSIASGAYPLARTIAIYVNRRPGQALAPLPRAFIEYILSDDGQQLVRDEGFVPLDAEEARRQRESLPSPQTVDHP